MAFSFGFSGDDIDTGSQDTAVPAPSANQQRKPSATPTSSAFPVPGKPQLPPTHHPLPALLSQLPSKIAFSCLDVPLDDGRSIRIPRRELWDVRVQLMAEDDGQEGGGGLEGLGERDVKTGVYEGGFKSWESSLDLVKVLGSSGYLGEQDSKPLRMIELGCGTALPSLAVFQWAATGKQRPTSFIIADYNPTVLQLVTLPNFILTWAMSQQASTPALASALSGDDELELELTPEVLEAFLAFLVERDVSLSFLSGAWSQEFVDLIYNSASESQGQGRDGDRSSPATVILGAETIYSPFALQAFTETVFSILERERQASNPDASALIGAKRLYFGVGGSLDDFVAAAQEKGALVSNLREETEGVRRGVVSCSLSKDGSAS